MYYTLDYFLYGLIKCKCNSRVKEYNLNRYGLSGEEDYDEKVVAMARSQFFPKLFWMSSLESLVILKKGFGCATMYPDECLKALVIWMFSTFDMDSIERVWIQDEFFKTDREISEKILYTPSIKSILLGFLNSDSELVRDQLQPLENLGGIFGFSELANLPNLRYMSGYCENPEVRKFLI